MIAWSHSRLKTFEACPYQFYIVNIAKQVRFETSEAMDAGKKAHKQLEDRLTKGKVLPPLLANIEGVCVKIDGAKAKGYQVLCEQQWCFDKDMQPVDWFAKDAWLRVILDAAIVGPRKALLIDWKTGRRDPDFDQLSLFSIAAFTKFPALQDVTTQYIWTKDGTVDTETFTRAQAPEIWASFVPRVEKIQEAERQRNWEKRPGTACRWCSVKKAGLCEGEG